MDLKQRNKQKSLNILFQKACEDGDMTKVVYYLTSPELEQYANIHADKNMALILAHEAGHSDIIDYIMNCEKYTAEKVEKSLVMRIANSEASLLLRAT